MEPFHRYLNYICAYSATLFICRKGYIDLEINLKNYHLTIGEAIGYLQLQSQHIQDRIDQFGGKLYLEFGGKLFDDYHASRVLPGFAPDSKVRMLEKLKDKAEILIAIKAGDIEKNKVRGDLGITYDSEVLRLIDIFRGRG